MRGDCALRSLFRGTTAHLVLSSRSVDYISFSAHVDYTQNSKFIDEVCRPRSRRYPQSADWLASQVMPSHLILVHGEVNNMSRLRAALKTRFAERKNDVQIYTPRNVETVKLKFRGERMAKVRSALDEDLSELADTLACRLSARSRKPHRLPLLPFPASSFRRTSPTLSSRPPTCASSPVSQPRSSFNDSASHSPSRGTSCGGICKECTARLRRVGTRRVRRRCG